MFTEAFVQEIVLPNVQSQPIWIAAPIEWAAGVAGTHIAVWNALFAAIQLAVGLALILDFKTRAALIGSLIWSFIVWWAGEGFGGLLTGSAALPSGAPGAIVFYALVAIVVWPEKSRTEAPAEARFLSDGRVRFARWSLAILWLMGAALELQPAARAGRGVGSVFSAPWMVGFVTRAGLGAIVILAVIDVAIAGSLLIPRISPLAAWASIVVSLFFWWTGQDFGQMTTPVGTDPNSGPLWILLTLCAFPDLLPIAGRHPVRPH